MNKANFSRFSCPLPKTNYATVQMAHGSGGRLSDDIIRNVFLPILGNTILNGVEDQARLQLPEGRLAFTTDSFVVTPIFFPGGSLGSLAVNGTVNDLVVGGARPLYLSASFIIEEGLPIETLHRILMDMRQALDDAGVQIVTADTKVVNKGLCDQIFINTSGIGVIPREVDISATRILPGDRILLSGSIGDHGMAIMSVREGLSFESPIQSDCAALNGLVEKTLQASKKIHAMRDPTRGGLATSLNELARASGVSLYIEEDHIPVHAQVQSACEILGIDPLYVANEGKLVALVAPDAAEEVLKAMRSHPLGKEACIIGEARADHPGKVILKNRYGVERIIDPPLGEQLPRIC